MTIERFNYSQTMHHYNRLAESNPPMIGMYVFNSKWNPLFRNYYEEFVLQKLLASCAIEINRDTTVLDLGCGGGRVCEFFAMKAGKVIGVDISASSLSAAKSNAEEMGLGNIEYIQASLDAYVPTETIHLAFFGGAAYCLDNQSLTEVLEHVTQRMFLGAHFLIRDSITNESHCLKKDFSACYRTTADFTNLLQRHQFNLIDRQTAFPHEVAHFDFSSIESTLNRLDPESVKNFFAELTTSINRQKDNTPTWIEGAYSYWHDFITYRRTNAD